MFAEFAVVVQGKLIVLLFLTLLDLLFGVILALRRGEFKWGKLVGYLDSDILPILAWLAVEGMALIPGELIPAGAELFAPQIVYATVFIAILASVAGHLSAFGLLTSSLQRVGIKPTGLREESAAGNANRG